MTLPVYPNSISMSQIQTEFGGSNPISLSEYYRGGANVPSGTSDGGRGLIATSGAISMDTFHGTSALKTIFATFTNQGHTGGTPADTQFSLSMNFAAMSPNNPSGNFAYSVTIATSNAQINDYTSSGNATGNFTYGGTSNLLLNLAIPYTAGTITATISKSGYATYTSTLSFSADTSQSYSWVSQPTTLNEGSGSTFTIATSFPNATFRYQVYHNYITGYPRTDSFDLVETDTFTTNGSGQGSFTITPYSDLVTEGTEDFDLYISYSGNGFPRLKSSNIVVNDISTTPILYGPYTTSGSVSVPTGMNYMSYMLIGGGGGGGGSGGGGVAAGGGGSAGLVKTTPWACAVSVTPGDTIAYTVGAGGGGGANGSPGCVPGSRGGNGLDSRISINGTPIDVAYGGGGGGRDHSGIGLKGALGACAPYICGGQGGSYAGGGGLGNGYPGATDGYQLLGYGYGGCGGAGATRSLNLRFVSFITYTVGAGGGGGLANSQTTAGPCTPYSGRGGSGGGGAGGISYGPDGLGFGSSGTGSPSTTYGNGGGGAASTNHQTGAIGGSGSGGTVAFYFFPTKV
jgi:hypothetical protein